MIIFKIKDTFLSQERHALLKQQLTEFFKPERVLVINGLDVEIIFHNEGKARCSYCGRLTNNGVCEHCGAPV
jgi:hypothetical protein